MPEKGYHFSEAEAFYFHLVTGCVRARHGESGEAEKRGGRMRRSCFAKLRQRFTDYASTLWTLDGCVVVVGRTAN